MSTNIPLITDNETFKYPKIAGADGFRLIRLIAGEREDPIQCSLTTGRVLEMNDRYTALSYVWGTDQADHLISVNEETFQIRKNLFDALKRLRSRTNELIIFIDAICINQADLIERSSQVKIMGEIYRGAKCTFAWLGEVDEETARKCSERLEFSIVHHDDWNYRLYDDVDGFAALEPLYLHEYWSRVWIVPEIQLSREVSMLWGPVKIEWKKLKESHRLCRGLYFRLEQQASASTTPSVTPLLLEHENSRSLYRLLLDYHLSKCQQPHDFVYALNTIARDTNARSLDIDYSKSLVEVLWEVFEFCRTTVDFNQMYLLVVLARQIRIAGSQLVASAPRSKLDFRLEVSYQTWVDRLERIVGPMESYEHIFESSTPRQVRFWRKDTNQTLITVDEMRDADRDDGLWSYDPGWLDEVHLEAYFFLSHHDDATTQGHQEIRGIAFDSEKVRSNVTPWAWNLEYEDFCVLPTSDGSRNDVRELSTNLRGLAWLAQCFL